MKPKILLVDDDKAILEEMQRGLDSDYRVFTASVADDAIRLYENEKPPVVTLDLSLSPADSVDLAGMRLLERFLSADPSTRVIVLTGHDHESFALRAMRLGAFDYYTKPVRFDELKVMINRGVHLHRLLNKVQQMNRRAAAATYSVTETSGPVVPARDATAADVNLKSAKKAMEMDFVKRALARNHGIVSRAARELGISRVNLYELIEKHDIHPREFKIPAREKSQGKTPEVR
jgi:DNA-binding NtrC family response regulator